MKSILKILVAIFLVSLLQTAWAEKLEVPIYSIDKPDEQIGTIKAEDIRYGLLLTPNIKEKSLTPGIHGFHIHENPSCDKKGKAAGGHYDPRSTGFHMGPYEVRGHAGDLPILIVNEDGSATLPVLAPRLAVVDLNKHSLIIHEKGDNYSDNPKKLGGGGDRVACAAITQWSKKKKDK